jgi:protein-disulfide isomerase-like protein with CxxC motif
MALYSKKFLLKKLAMAKRARAVDGQRRAETRMLLRLVAAIGMEMVVLPFLKKKNGQFANLENAGILAQTMQLALARQQAAQAAAAAAAPAVAAVVA